MRMNPQTPEAYQLLHDGSLALADAEAYGFTVDMNYCREAKAQIAMDKQDIEEKFWETELGIGWKQWGRKYRETPTLGSDQLAKVFTYLEIGGKNKTDTGKISTDEESLKEIDIDGIIELLQMRKMEKASGTYLNQLLNEAVDGIVHPMFSLNIPKTYRSSCSNPSIQNFPIRDPWQGKIIRNAIIPRKPNRRIVEGDFSGLEVRVAACYNKDKKLIYDILEGDMHRDSACLLFLLDKDDVDWKNKNTGYWVRHAAKNMFVFPEFYGSFYEECAKNLWKRSSQIFVREGVTVRQHLKSQGITTLGRFTKHVKSVEDSFWNDWYKIYTKWKKNHYDSYRKKGFVDSLTGFRFSGEMKKTEVINYPIQGAAFHCNLWCFIRVNYLLRKYKMSTHLIGQIHDSIIGDVLDKETDDFYEIIHQVTQEELAQNYKWINVAMEVEIEAAPLGASWYEKKEVVFT